MTELADVTIREYRPGDEEAILASFNRVFAPVDPGFRPRTLAGWRWRFEQNPSGSRVMLAIDAKGTVLAQYAGLGVRLRIDGEVLPASQSVDSFCDPGARGGLASRGLFVRTGEPFAALFGGPEGDRDRFMYGLPVPVAWRVGRRHLGYHFLNPLWRLELRVEPPTGLEQQVQSSVEAASAFPVDVEALFERCAPEHGAIAVRDRAQLQWRFVDNPEHDYRIGLARRAGRLVGYAVHRMGSFDGEDGALVCDWLCPREECDAAVALAGWCAEQTRILGAQRLSAVFTEHCQEFSTFQALGFRVRPSRYFFVGRSYEEQRDPRWWAENLYLTLADTDLV